MTLKLDLVVASRTLADHGVIDAYGHASARSDANPQRYFMARNVAPELVTEADILEYDLDSNPIDANGRPVYHERFIHGEINALLQLPDIREAFAKQGLTPVVDKPERLGDLVEKEIARWNRVVATAGIRE